MQVRQWSQNKLCGPVASNSALLESAQTWTPQGAIFWRKAPTGSAAENCEPPNCIISIKYAAK